MIYCARSSFKKRKIEITHNLANGQRLWVIFHAAPMGGAARAAVHACEGDSEKTEIFSREFLTTLRRLSVLIYLP
jgi:hypothetical protein